MIDLTIPLDSVRMTVSTTDSPYSTDYFTARRRFREAAARRGWSLEAWPIEATGPKGEPLTIDVALSPDPGTGRTVVVSSGLHGVEGFFGSAIQLSWLERESKYPCRYVFLHALNPFGFAWVRRYDEGNVDPNRNFLLPGERYEGSPPGYAELDHLLNTPVPPRRWDPFVLRAAWNVFRVGLPAMKRIIMTGQYDYPRGVFFGGSGPSRSNAILCDHFDRWLSGAREVIHLDFHCGLGPWATYKLLVDYALTGGQRQKLAERFGPESIEECHEDGTAYVAHGDFGRWCMHQNVKRDYLFACAEFGTYGPITMLAGIRAENQAHQWGRADDPATHRAKRRLKQLFCPVEASWRTTVVSEGLHLIDRAGGH